MPDDGLLALQRRFVAALREPITGDSRARTELPPREGEPSPAFRQTAETLLTPSASLSAVDRLELYHRQYWYRLLDSLAEDFPGVRLIVGEVAFWSLLEAYVEAEPPRDFTLRRLGAGLAAFVAAHPSRVRHPIHVAEMARLEAALCVAFEAADRPPIDPSALATAPLALAPHVQLLACRTPADTLWRRADDQQPRGPLRAAATEPTRFLVVFRDRLRLHIERLPRPAHGILSAIARTGSLDHAIEGALAGGGLGAASAARIQGWFAGWTARGWLCGQVTIPAWNASACNVPVWNETI